MRGHGVGNFRRVAAGFRVGTQEQTTEVVLGFHPVFQRLEDRVDAACRLNLRKETFVALGEHGGDQRVFAADMLVERSA
ncbi:hypothetical protein D3C78_1694570 [compost metagenome]